jgi:cyclic dehypoxanthinyl futalosine synthase
MVTRTEALELLESDDLVGIGMRADAVRRRLHPGQVVSYGIDGGVEDSGETAAIFDIILEVDGREEWAAGHRAAHAMGMKTVANMQFGRGETLAQRIEGLELVRQLQEETGGIAAFSAVSGQGEITAVEYLKMLAVSRIYLENVPNIQASVAVHGLKTCQVALRFGGNDVGGVSGAESVTEEELRRVIRDAGFVPKQRDAGFGIYFLN